MLHCLAREAAGDSCRAGVEFPISIRYDMTSCLPTDPDCIHL